MESPSTNFVEQNQCSEPVLQRNCAVIHSESSRCSLVPAKCFDIPKTPPKLELEANYFETIRLKPDSLSFRGQFWWLINLLKTDEFSGQSAFLWNAPKSSRLTMVLTASGKSGESGSRTLESQYQNFLKTEIMHFKLLFEWNFIVKCDEELRRPNKFTGFFSGFDFIVWLRTLKCWQSEREKGTRARSTARYTPTRCRS